jgi:hypothetical protein
MEKCPQLENAKLEKCWQKLTDEIIQGDYIGTLRGQVNICMNIINYYKALGHAVDELCSEELRKNITDRAYQIRAERYGKLLW